MSYQPTAYNSQTFTPQPSMNETQNWSERIHKRGEIFPFSQVNDCIATSAVRDQEPSIVGNSNRKSNFYWNNQRLQPYTFVKWISFYILVASIAKLALIVAYPFFLILSLIVYIKQSTPDGAIELLTTMTWYIAFPSIIVYFPVLWVNRCKPKFDYSHISLFARKKYCLNRETGMVTLYGEHNRKIFSHPFIEFDCILASNPNHQGLLSYRLMLVHRYSDYAQGVNIGSLVGVNAPLAEYRRLWNMIQQYMDVSKPLPDIPMLEQFRELDPTTAAYDQQHQRNPNYWRSMSDEEFDKTLTEMARNQREQNIPPTGPEIDIFAKA
ncbi:hypothetical protein [Vibrio gazogenes]|uniref:Uncharacterized protein n=1 Tax=Vibrio gazogenes TaxID=687 RepID=A0A1Z2SEU7_VIBGA|nr:hypothetical protein [Vibrio gazogenes]ASA55637.1 hypothetical protein BSQ33_07955 [Vibrio gazogenes]